MLFWMLATFSSASLLFNSTTALHIPKSCFGEEYSSLISGQMTVFVNSRVSQVKGRMNEPYLDRAVYRSVLDIYDGQMQSTGCVVAEGNFSIACTTVPDESSPQFPLSNLHPRNLDISSERCCQHGEIGYRQRKSSNLHYMIRKK